MVRDDRHLARCGHLYVRIEQDDAYKTPGHPDYEPPSCEWFVEPDDEDKSYRRALATGREATVDAAKEAATAACESLIASMLASLRGVRVSVLDEMLASLQAKPGAVMPPTELSQEFVSAILATEE